LERRHGIAHGGSFRYPEQAAKRRVELSVSLGAKRAKGGLGTLTQLANAGPTCRSTASRDAERAALNGDRDYETPAPWRADG